MMMFLLAPPLIFPNSFFDNRTLDSGRVIEQTARDFIMFYDSLEDLYTSPVYKIFLGLENKISQSHPHLHAERGYFLPSQ